MQTIFYLITSAIVRDSYSTLVYNFWATVCKTDRSIDAIRPFVQSVCLDDVSLFWPSGWIDQDETWRGGMVLAQATLC